MACGGAQQRAGDADSGCATALIRHTQSGVRVVVVLLLGEQVAAGVHEDEPRAQETQEKGDGGGDDPALDVEAFERLANVIGKGWIRHAGLDARRLLLRWRAG